MWSRVRSLFRGVARRREFECDMTEELRFHIEQYTAELIAGGLSPDEANRRARIEFGGINTVAEECRQARGLRLLDELSRQLRHTLRSLRKTPAFTVTALLMLAICSGANLVIFAVIDSVLLRPLPFPQARQLVTIYNTYPKAGVERDGSSLTNYYERRGRIPAFSSVSIYAHRVALVGEPGSVHRQEITQVSPDFFTTLGVAPAVGRTFAEEETTPGNNNLAIITSTYWRNHFQSDPHVLGRHIRIDTQPLTVVGVLPPHFRFLSSEAQVYVPLASPPQARAPRQRHSGGNVIQMIARLRPDATIAQAQSQIDAQNTALEADDPQGPAMAAAGFRSLVVSLHGDHVASIRPTLFLLQSGVLLLLLIGTVNLANLLLIRVSSRGKEAAVRQALGASRAHILSEALVETTVLTMGGGLLGLAFTAGCIRLLTFLGAERLPMGSQIRFDAHLAWVFVFAAIVLGILLAAPVAWFNLHHQLDNALKSETRGGHAGHAAQKLRFSFTVAQIAVAFVLLVGAGLLGLGLKRAMSVSPGFQPQGVLSGQVALVGGKYTTPETGVIFSERLTDALNRQPGIIAAGMASNIPFSGHNGKSAAVVSGHVTRPDEAPRGHYSYGVAGNYFRAMGFSLIEGRFLTADDSRRTQRVCVVDQDFARYYWPHASAVGQRLFQGAGPKPDREAFTVVGVVSSARQAGLTDESAPGAVYYPFRYFLPDNHLFVVARTTGSLSSLASTLRQTLHGIDPELSLDDLRAMDARISDSLLPRRSPALLAGAFSAIALLLTAIGTYGVLAYAVAQRRREIGVRMALGARPEQIRTQFLLLAARLLAMGSVLGLIGSWFAGRAMDATLFHVTPFDLPTLLFTTTVIAAVSLGACLLPAHRAARISPIEALAEN